MTNSQKQLCQCENKASHTAGWRHGSGIVVMCTTMEVCCPTLELERLSSDYTASWGQMEGEKRNTSAWLMGSETDQSITGILSFTFRKGHPSPQKLKNLVLHYPLILCFVSLGKLDRHLPQSQTGNQRFSNGLQFFFPILPTYSQLWKN